MDTPTIQDAFHVITGDSAAGALRQLGARDLIVLRDPMFPGPCDVNPIRHRRKRLDFLPGYYDALAARNQLKYMGRMSLLADDLLNAHDVRVHFAGRPAEKPAVLWTTASWKHGVTFWWLLDALQRTRQSVRRFWVAQPSGPYLLGECSRSAFAHAMASARPLTAELRSKGASLWRAFAGSCPADFDALRRQRCPHFPDLPAITNAYGFFFPRLARGRLLLSEGDQMLFDALRTDRWLRPITLLRTNPRLIDTFLRYADDLFLLRRLREWAQTPALLMRPENDIHEYTMEEFQLEAFRLTEMGESIRTRGLPSPHAAPAMFVGGYEVYRSPLWGRRRRGSGWRLELATY